MKNILGGVLIALLYIVGIGLFLSGLVHSFKKHGAADGCVGVAFFPWALYRGIELYWHDDYADVDWEKRLETDTRSCIYFLQRSAALEGNQYEIGEDLEKFRKKIKKYPSEKFQNLKTTSRGFANLINSINMDILTALDNAVLSGYFKIELSEKTNRLEKSLSNKYLQEDIESAKKVLNELPEREIDTNTLTEIKGSFIVALEKQHRELNRVFEYIFDEQLDFVENTGKYENL
jgi:hypothetical protein